MQIDERLAKVAGIIAERGTSRDLPRGERSIAKACAIFNAITGHSLSVPDGWRFMIALKLARMSAGKYKEDDYDDLIGYSALLAEEEFNRQQETGK